MRFRMSKNRMFSETFFHMRKYRKSYSTRGLCRLICRKKSGLQIRPSVTDSSPERLILPNRLSLYMIICTDSAVRRALSARVSFSSTVKRTGMRPTNVWKEDTNFRRLRPGSVRIKRIFSLSKKWELRKPVF